MHAYILAFSFCVHVRHSTNFHVFNPYKNTLPVILNTACTKMKVSQCLCHVRTKEKWITKKWLENESILGLALVLLMFCLSLCWKKQLDSAICGNEMCQYHTHDSDPQPQEQRWPMLHWQPCFIISHFNVWGTRPEG